MENVFSLTLPKKSDMAICVKSPPNSPQNFRSPRHSFKTKTARISIKNYMSERATILSTEITKLKKRIEEYTLLNEALKKNILILENSIEDDILKKDKKDFEKELVFLSQLLKKQIERIDEKKKTHDIFKKQEAILPDIKKQFPKVNYLIKPSPSLPPDKQLVRKNKKHLDDRENEFLINTALYNDRILNYYKMKLNIYHDMRELSHMNRFLNQGDMSGFFVSPNEAEEKRKIKNIKRYIELEHQRLESIKDFNSKIYNAAIILQKLWRGYYIRKQILKEGSLQLFFDKYFRNLLNTADLSTQKESKTTEATSDIVSNNQSDTKIFDGEADNGTTPKTSKNDLSA